MATTNEIADSQRIKYGTSAGEESVSLLARNLVSKDGSVIFDAEAIKQQDATALAAIQELLGIGGGGETPTLAEVLAEGADGGATSQTNLGNLTLATGKTATADLFAHNGLYTVATLPEGAPQGTRACVSDQNGAQVFGDGAIGGGSNICPVFFDGNQIVKWRIG